jgi:putative transposase
VTQRGNRRETTFFAEADYLFYRGLLGEAAAKAGAEIWAYCLMPNHVHAIVTPRDTDGLRRTFGELHRRYTGHINARHRWTGHLWQARFGSVAMDEDHLIAAIRYVSLNPVRARLVERAENWPWSSVRAHLAGRDDGVVTVGAVLERVGPFDAFLDQAFDETAAFAPLRRAETSGRPIGSEAWPRQLERDFARPLAPRKRGPKPRESTATAEEELFSGVNPWNETVERGTVLLGWSTDDEGETVQPRV